MSDFRAMTGEWDSVQQMQAYVADSLYVKTMGQHDGSLMLAMSFLSDAQEVIAGLNPHPADYEQNRKWINCAKVIMAECMEHDHA